MVCIFERVGCYGDLLAIFAPGLMLPLHIAVIASAFKSNTILNPSSCNCECWDRIFKGSDDNNLAETIVKETSHYKHVYFNATRNSAKIWLLIVFGVIGFYETIRYLMRLAVRHRLHWGMFLLYCSSFFIHYYSWWIYFNYWNDDSYDRWYHQMVFTVSELTSTFLVLTLANKDNGVTTRKVLLIVYIAIFHIIASSMDLFISSHMRLNNLQHDSVYMDEHYLLRDLYPMIMDVLHVVLPLYTLKKKTGKMPTLSELRADNVLKKDFKIFIVVCLSGLLLCQIV